MLFVNAHFSISLGVFGTGTEHLPAYCFNFATSMVFSPFFEIAESSVALTLARDFA